MTQLARDTECEIKLMMSDFYTRYETRLISILSDWQWVKRSLTKRPDSLTSARGWLTLHLAQEGIRDSMFDAADIEFSRIVVTGIELLKIDEVNAL